MKENLYCKGQRWVTKDYREGYDGIRWDDANDKEYREDVADAEGGD